MKKKITILVMGAAVFGSLFLLSAWVPLSQPSTPGGEWVVPASANNLKNPVKGNTEATEKGKKLYKQMCAICHGSKGKGDGVAGMSLTPRPSNFTSAKIQNQSDGAIYWKLTEGRAPMASYKQMLKDDQRWQLVNYIRTFKK
jgi:mono/diheme cytochrome c family protein